MEFKKPVKKISISCYSLLSQTHSKLETELRTMTTNLYHISEDEKKIILQRHDITILQKNHIKRTKHN